MKHQRTSQARLGNKRRTKGSTHNIGSGLSPHSGLSKSYDRKNKRDVWSVTNKPYKEVTLQYFHLT